VKQRRNRRNGKPMYRQTEAEMAQHIEESVRNMEGMCGLFDSGNAYIAFSLAAEIHKVLTTGQNIALFRADMRFPTVSFEYSPGNLAAEHKLIMADQHAHSDQNPPVYIDFIPASADGSFPIKWLSFRDWWNRDVIYRASAAPPGTPVGRIPTDERAQVPKNKRKTFSRRELIEAIRNKLGAHLDRHIPEELNQLQKAHAFGISIRVTVDGKTLDTLDGSMPMKTGPGAAMVRQIAHEVLEAFRLKKVEPRTPDTNQPADLS
jgi:hypothetical protein